MFKSEEIGQVNPPKFEKCEDMANLTFLNEASVFWNLKTRYQAKLIYTYSGLFCVVVNPYKRFPIYTPRVVKMYLGKRRNEVPPHLWAITETAYRNMLQNSKDQSMLITGESGAGKTENTKKVIAYLAMVATSGKKEKKVSLEDQIVATNPILESYGNAKTSRNDNSSRFGKFIRIHFNAAGKLAGCDIQSYLLEKSRITQQQEVERSYHIFYQLLQPFIPDLKSKCLLSDDIYFYSYVSQGKTTVPSIDDNEELQYTDDAFNVLGFTEEEKWDCFKLTAAVMTMGEMKFKQKGRDEQCEPDAPEVSSKVATLCGIDQEAMMKAFCKPKIKVGTEWVTKGQNIGQSTNAVGGIARGIYSRLFNWLILKCNDTLIDPTMKKVNFCAVLDIAGFEIFEYNGFEQISINFVNEKLQQFFNHHMFVVEQQEYISEGIDWVMVDFGMDLQACIIMFEKPMGVWAIIEEESLFPKASDKTLEDKLKGTLLGKTPSFAKPQSKTDKNAHFAIVHYAGTVSYNVTGWLEKNKDPVNDTVVDIMKKSSCRLLTTLWIDHPGQSNPPEEKKGKKKKGGGSKTVSGVFLADVAALMNTLHSTEPHFIRCLVPNTHKQPGGVEPQLVMHQLTCNGVLEGIRICMRGFPNRILFPDFKQRYAILSGGKVNKDTDPKASAGFILEATPGFEAEKYRIGHTKVFFRAGALAMMEEARDDIVMKLTRNFQGMVRGYVSRKKFSARQKQRDLIMVIQRTFRSYIRNRDWAWFTIIQKTRPLIGMPNPEEELANLENIAKEKYGAYEEQLETKNKLEAENDVLRNEIGGLKERLQNEQGDLSSYEEKIAKLNTQNADLEAQLSENTEKIKQEESLLKDFEKDTNTIEKEYKDQRKDYQDLVAQQEKLENEVMKKDNIIKSLNDDVAAKDETLSKLNKEKKQVQQRNDSANEELTTVEGKVAHLTDVKNKLEHTLDEMEAVTDREKKQKYNIEKERRRLDGDLKMCQSAVSDLEKERREMEQSIMRKDTEMNSINSRLGDEQGNIGRVQRSIKELTARIDQLEDELEAERQARAKSEKQRSELAREYDDMKDQLEENSMASESQKELNKKRENEIVKMKKDFEENCIQNEATILSLKKKHQEAVSELSEQVDQLAKIKARFEKDKVPLKMQLEDSKIAMDHVLHERSLIEKNLSSWETQLKTLESKIAELGQQLGSSELQNKRMAMENSESYTKLEELLNNVSILQKNKIFLSGQLEEAKQGHQEEVKERQTLMSRFRNVEIEFSGVREQLDDATQQKDDSIRMLNKVSSEANTWRMKFENEAITKIEEHEAAKMKLQARLNESESTIENLNNKLVILEKSKFMNEKSIEEAKFKLDQASARHGQAEKKVKSMDRSVGDWKRKADDIAKELSGCQMEQRTVASEMFRLKNGKNDSENQLEEVLRENKTLSDEIKNLMEQISDGGRTIHEIDKKRKRLDAEKKDLESALGDAENALELEENKLLKLTLDVNQLKADIDKRIQEKEEEFENTKKNHTKAVEQIQFAIEEESKSKAEAVRMKKKLEQDMSELEGSLKRSTLENSDLHVLVRRQQESLKAKSEDIENSRRDTDNIRDYLITAERKVSSLKNAVEETRSMLEQSDKARRGLEQELTEDGDELAKMMFNNAALDMDKRRLDADLAEAQVTWKK